MNLTTSLLHPATATIHQQLIAIVLAFLQAHMQPGTPNTVVLLPDTASIDLAASIQRAAIFERLPAARPTWLLAPWSHLITGQASALFESAPLVVIVVRQSAQHVTEQLANAFDWRQLNSQSRYLVLIEHDTIDAAKMQNFVSRSAHAGRFFTLAAWHTHATKPRLFQRPPDAEPLQLDYYMSLDPPHTFRTIGWSPAVAAGQPGAAPTGFGGSEVWLVSMLAEKLNRSVHYHVYDYASFQPDDCADCDFYMRHYFQPLPLANARQACSTNVTAANNRMLRKLSHSAGPVVYTGLSHLQLNDLDIETQAVYPYSYENYRIVVPAELQRPTYRTQLLLLAAWLATLLALFAVRLAVSRWLEADGCAGGGRRRTTTTAAALGMQTLGVALAASTAQQPRARAEWVWLGTLSGFALMVGISCAGVLFQQLTVPVEQNSIETLQQLVADGRYNLMVPFSDSLPPGLSEALRM